MPESKTPNIDQAFREMEQRNLGCVGITDEARDYGLAMIRSVIDADIATLEAQHADELTDAVANAIKLCHEEKAKAIAKARREAYEDGRVALVAARFALASGNLTVKDVQSLIDGLMNKAGKL